MNNNNNVFFESKFLNSKIFFYAIPSLYFLTMLFISLSNRLIGDYGVETDFYVAYVSQAKKLLNGNLIIDQYRGPVYQILLAISGFILKSDFYLAGKILNVICAGVSLFFISKLISSILNREDAFLVILFVSVNQVFWRYTYEPGTDMLFLVFYSSSLYCLLKSDNFNSNNLLLSGFLSGLGYLTRYTGISLIIFALIVFILKYYKMNKNENINKKINFFKPVLYYLIPVILLTTCWGIICYKSTGHFIYNMNYQNTAYTVYKPDAMSKDEWTSKYQSTFNSMSDVVFKEFGTFTKKIGSNFANYFIKDLFRFFPKYIGILAGIGLIVFLLKWKSESNVKKYFFLVNLLFYLQILLIFYAERFSIPLLPFYCFLIVNLFSQDFLQRFNFNLPKIKLFGLILISLVLINFYNSYTFAKDDINNVPVEILKVQDFIKKNYNEELYGKSIMARKPQIAYYLNMQLTGMPYSENYSEFIQNVKQSNVDYIFISENEGLISSNEDLKKNLLHVDSTPDELEVITSTTDPVTILYKVKK